MANNFVTKATAGTADTHWRKTVFLLFSHSFCEGRKEASQRKKKERRWGRESERLKGPMPFERVPPCGNGQSRWPSGSFFFRHSPGAEIKGRGGQPEENKKLDTSLHWCRPNESWKWVQNQNIFKKPELKIVRKNELPRSFEVWKRELVAGKISNIFFFFRENNIRVVSKTKQLRLRWSRWEVTDLRLSDLPTAPTAIAWSAKRNLRLAW